MKNSNPLKKGLLYALVASVIFGALLGIYLVLSQNFGWFSIRVILTTLTIAVSSLCGLACNLSKTPRGINLLPNAGMLLTAVSTTLILIGIWFGIDPEPYWITVGCISIFSFATVHICLLSIAKLAPRFRWVYYLTCQMVYGLAALLCMVILDFFDDPSSMQLIIVVSIVDGALTILIPLLHRISKTDPHPSVSLTSPLEERNIAAIDREIESLRKQIADLEKLRAEMSGQT